MIPPAGKAIFSRALPAARTFRSPTQLPDLLQLFRSYNELSPLRFQFGNLFRVLRVQSRNLLLKPQYLPFQPDIFLFQPDISLSRRYRNFAGHSDTSIENRHPTQPTLHAARRRYASSTHLPPDPFPTAHAPPVGTESTQNCPSESFHPAVCCHWETTSPTTTLRKLRTLQLS